MKCRVCGNIASFFQTIKNARVDGGSLNREVVFKIKTMEVDIYKCNNCGHSQIKYLLDNDYYEQYNEVSGYKQYYSVLNKIEEKITKLSRLSLDSESLIEIGSGGGDALKLAQKYFNNVIGIDPGKNICELAEKKGLKVVCSEFNDEFVKNHVELNGKVSAFQTFQVLEHIEDIDLMLKCAYEMLEENGVGLINVPNGEQILKNGLYHQILLEHINYYSPQSLITAVEKNGFEVLDIVLDRETIEIDLYIKKSKPVLLEDVKKKMSNCLNILLKKYSDIGVYGGGAKSAFYSSIIDTKKVKYIFDSDIKKSGTYISGINKKIEKLEKNIMGECEAIIIFASSYNDEIIEKLKKNDYKGDIIIFEGNEVKKVNMSEGI